MKKTTITAIAITMSLSITVATPQETQENIDGPCYDAKNFTEPSMVKFNWKSIELSISGPVKKKELARIKGGIQSYIDAQTAGGGMDLDHFIAGMHIVDINGDKLPDIVFEITEMGWPAVYIYLNNGVSYTSVFHAQCYMKSINPKEKRIVVNTYTTGGYSLHNYELELAMYTSKAAIHTARHFSEGTLFPRVFSSSKKCTVGKKGALLALQPPIKGCLPGQMPGFFEYPEGATGHILATHKEKSATWHFVLMDNTIGPEWTQGNDQDEVYLYVPDEYLTDPDKKMKAGFYGWMDGKSITVK